MPGRQGGEDRHTFDCEVTFGDGTTRTAWWSSSTTRARSTTPSPTRRAASDTGAGTGEETGGDDTGGGADSGGDDDGSATDEGEATG